MNTNFKGSHHIKLLHCRFKAVGGQDEDTKQIYEKLQEFTANELRLAIKEKTEKYFRFQKLLHPLQIILDRLVEDESNFLEQKSSEH